MADESELWKRQIGKLQDLGKDEDANGIKTWLRGQHAETIRERKRGALAQDFDLIGTEFHRWARDHETSYGDLPYAEKREHYLKQNLLAQSLHEFAYERNPGFLRFAKASMLPFQQVQIGG